MRIRSALCWLLPLLLLGAGCARSRATRDMRQFKGSIIEEPASEPVLAGARPSVVAVESLDAKGRPLGYGTGFYIRPDQVVTCLHVIEPAVRLQLVLADGTRHQVAGIHGTDMLLDLAVLWVTNAPPSGDGLRLRDRPAEVGETTYLMAAPEQLPLRTSKGSVLAQKDLGSELINEAIVLSVPAVPGFSGGPVLDGEGAVVGVLSQIYKTTQGSSSVAVPVGEVRGIADAPAEPWLLWRERNPALNPQAIADVRTAETIGLDQENLKLQYLNRALRIAPDYTKAWVKKGFCMFRLGHHAEAAGAFGKALALEPGLITARLFLSMCLGMNKQPVEALVEANAVVAQRPRSVFAQTWLAATRADNYDPLGAIETMKTAVQLGPNQAITRNAFARLWNNLGCPVPAEQEFRETLRLQPRMRGAWENLGMILLETGRIVEAAEALNQALKVSRQESSAASYLIFLIAAKSGNEQEAKRRFEDFLKVEETRTKRAGKSDQAGAILNQIKRKPWNDQTTFQGLTDLFLQTHRRDLARFNLEHHLKLYPETPGGWTLLALLHRENGRYELASEAARKAIALKPDDAFAYFQLGAAQAALGELESARDSLIRSEGFGRRPAEAELALACIESRAGNSAKAAEYLAEAKRRNAELTKRFEARPESFIPEAVPIRAAASIR